MFIRIGAEIDAPVIIATVPEPWIRRTRELITKGISTAGMARPATAWPITSPAPESRRTEPRAPPAPVTSRMMPALSTPCSMYPSTSSRGRPGSRV